MAQWEILAPAGNEEMLRAAVFSGADAVYLGLTSFNARRSAGNFTPEALKEAVSFCHARGVKVYVTLNTTIYTDELPAMEQTIKDIAEAGADAAIVQDLGVAKLVKLCAPELPLHGSTQMSIHSLAGAKQLAKMGFSRVIPARELSLEEIQVIAQNCGIEVECFVHGAMCMSISGQCMMSAFLGGRSGNRGSCAGPCRLPFAADGSGQAHLSLKDMSLLDHMQEMHKAGVCSFKIEGRMRTPEYVAAVVTACRAAREGETFDRQLVKGVFSRSGFTDGYLTGQRDGRMFGVRTKADTEEGKKALPQAREAYRRELGRIAVDMTLTIEEEGAKLKCTDGTATAVVYLEQLPEPAQKEQTAAIERCLSKTGGTPFVVGKIMVQSEKSWYLPANALNEARRQVLDQLLQKRSKVEPWEYHSVPLEQVRHTMPAKKQLWARFAAFEQLDLEQSDRFEKIILPIAQAEKVPPSLREKTILELPRAMFGVLEQDTKNRIQKAAKEGFAGFEAQNLAHFFLCQGLPVFAGFGMNLTNQLSAQAAADLGAKAVTLLPELSAQQIEEISPTVPTGAIGYGHLPLMLTRACPMHNVRSCQGCPKRGELTDRKNRQFPVRCGLGVRTIFNPVPLYLGDKPKALNCDYEILYFSIESPDRIRQVVELYTNNQPFDKELTRGLYFKGTD